MSLQSRRELRCSRAGTWETKLGLAYGEITHERYAEAGHVELSVHRSFPSRSSLPNRCWDRGIGPAQSNSGGGTHEWGHVIVEASAFVVGEDKNRILPGIALHESGDDRSARKAGAALDVVNGCSSSSALLPEALSMKMTSGSARSGSQVAPLHEPWKIDMQIALPGKILGEIEGSLEVGKVSARKIPSL